MTEVAGVEPTISESPPAPPRELTKRARRRSWGEPRVRSWVAVTLIILASALGVGIGQGASWWHDSRLNRHGKLIDATLIGASMGSRKGEKVPGGMEAFLRYTINGQEHVVVRRMPTDTGSFFVDGSLIPIRVDPENPEDWTMRVTVPPFVHEMIGPIFLLPFGVVTAVAGLVARWRVLRVWREGVARQVTVLGSRNTALAPASRVLRCANLTGTDKRIFDVLLPKRYTVEAGDSLWVVSLPGALQPALPAAAYR